MKLAKSNAFMQGLCVESSQLLVGCKGASRPRAPQSHLPREEQPTTPKASQQGLTCRAAHAHLKLRAGVGGQTKPRALHLIDGKQFKRCFAAVQGALIPSMT